MELDQANLIQIFSFDGRVVTQLLDNIDPEKHSAMYPLFYKMTHDLKENGIKITTAIEIALENNQIRALNSIIEYCVLFQNSYCFTFLFEDFVIELIGKGIRMTPLFESSIFNHVFEFENWPAIHENNQDICVPYNGSKFHLKNRYNQVFGFLGKVDAQGMLDEDSGKDKKYYKIKYSLNLLPTTTYVDDKCENIDELLENLGESDELDMFDCKIVKDYYNFMWNSWGKYVHYLGAVIHSVYFLMFVIYVNATYLHRDYEARVPLCWMMLICIIYPMFYDTLQLFKQGREYLQDPWNFVD